MDFKDASFMLDLVNEYLIRTDIRHKKTTRGFECRCPSCLDSTKDKSKMRGAFFVEERGGEWIGYYKCLNGGCTYNRSRSIQVFFNTHCPDLATRWDAYKGYVPPKRGLASYLNSKASMEEWKRKEEERKAQIEREEAEKIADDLVQIKYFVPLKAEYGTDPMRISAIREAIKYCKDRLIPQEIYETWMVPYLGKYSGRVIIPFYRKGEMPYYFQGRALYDHVIPKYKNRHGRKEFYNVTFVDWERPVMVLEGAIDSIFVENSFALNGIAIGGDAFSEFPKDKIFMIQDNDEAGKQKALDLIECEYSVFMWARFLRAVKDKFGEPYQPIKDINDVVKFTKHLKWDYEILKGFFTNSLDDEIHLMT